MRLPARNTCVAKTKHLKETGSASTLQLPSALPGSLAGRQLPASTEAVSCYAFIRMQSTRRGPCTSLGTGVRPLCTPACRSHLPSPASSCAGFLPCCCLFAVRQHGDQGGHSPGASCHLLPSSGGGDTVHPRVGRFGLRQRHKPLHGTEPRTTG